MKVKVQVKDLIQVLKGMDPDEVIFEYELTPEEILAEAKCRQLDEWAEKIRKEIKEIGLEAYFAATKAAQEQAASLLEVQHSGCHGA